MVTPTFSTKPDSLVILSTLPDVGRQSEFKMATYKRKYAISQDWIEVQRNSGGYTDNFDHARFTRNVAIAARRRETAYFRLQIAIYIAGGRPTSGSVGIITSESGVVENVGVATAKSQISQSSPVI